MLTTLGAVIAALGRNLHKVSDEGWFCTDAGLVFGMTVGFCC
jgi:hypothetical protein